MRSRKLGNSDDAGRESFPCHHVCGNCGWLADSKRGACPSCKRDSWIDLTHANTAEALRAHERATPTLGAGEELLVKAGGAVAVTAWICAGVALSMISLPVIGSATALITGGLLAQHVCQPLREALHRCRARTGHPARRRLALPPAEGLVGRVRGHANPRSVLRSPVEDQPCLAWRIRARLDDDGHEQLIIDDSRSVAFELGGRSLEADAVEIDAPVEHVRLSELESKARERVIRFLRSRGCFSHEGDWTLEIQQIELGHPIELEGRGHKQAPVLRHGSDAASTPYR